MFSAKELSEIFRKNIRDNISGICIDSQQIQQGDLFVALKGEKFDAHNFVVDVFAKGAALAIVEEEVSNVDQGKLIKVDSSLDGLKKLAKYNVEKSAAKYIAITGSVGKTTTKDMINHLLKNFFGNDVYASRKNLNSQIGLPLCAALMPRSTKYGIFEMGMSQFGEIKNLIEIVPPNISLITGICETHLEFFNSIWNTAKAKSEIFETQRPQECAIIPCDSPYTDFLRQKAQQCGVKKILTSGRGDAELIQLTHSRRRLIIKAKILGQVVDYSINGLSESMADCSLSAILAAHAITEISTNQLAEALENFSPTDGRGSAISLNNDIILIDDSYNACPTSLKAAIRSLRNYGGTRKILAIGDMKELGRDEINFHENISPTIDKYGIDKVFACGNLAKYLYENLRDEIKGAWAQNSTELTATILQEIKPGDRILVKGSHSMRMSELANALIEKFGLSKE